MREQSVRDLVDRVVADVDDGVSRIQQMFEWHFARDMSITKWVLSAAAGLGTAFLVAVFKAEISPNWWQIIFMVVIPLSISSYGFNRLLRLRSIHRQFVQALRLHAELKEIRPFLVLYRRRAD